ncbi:MAG: hypothetical protein MUC91_14010, partial [Verrucomicrobia bacterium]|nr:hypothetical protein [Verrucomicrobiota bacterium]
MAVPPEVTYNRETQQLSVNATGQSLLAVLGQLTSQTGWLIFVEPESNPAITTNFKDAEIGAALESLVGNMNYAMIPQSDGPTKLFIFRTSRGNATLQVRAAEDETVTIRRVGNELIVTVEPGTDIEALAKKLGAKVTGQLEGTNTYRLTFEDDAAADSARTQLAGEPGVKRVDNNYVVDGRKPAQTVAQGPQPPVKLTLNPPSGNGGIIVGLVDTGVQRLGGDLDQFLLKPESVSGDSALPSDELTHGTSMAETILRSIALCSGGDTSIQILPIDIYGSNPTTSSFAVA